MEINNIPSSIDAIITKNPISFTPFKMDYSIMTIGYFQVMSYGNDSGVKFFVHVKKQGYNSFSVLRIQGCRRFISQNDLRFHDDSPGKHSSGFFSAGAFKRFLFQYVSDLNRADDRIEILNFPNTPFVRTGIKKRQFDVIFNRQRVNKCRHFSIAPIYLYVTDLSASQKAYIHRHNFYQAAQLY